MGYGTCSSIIIEMRPSRLNKYHKNEAYPLVKLYSTICVAGPVIMLVLV